MTQHERQMHESYKSEAEPGEGTVCRQTTICTGLVLLIVAIGMTIYEYLKQILWSDISIWQSHMITIAFSSILAALAAYFFIRRQVVLRLHLKEKEQLQSAIETAGAVCHEINQPLQYLMSQIELMLSKGEPHNVSREMIINMLKEVKRMGEITWRLQHITRFRTREYADGFRILDLDKSVAQNEDQNAGPGVKNN